MPLFRVHVTYSDLSTEKIDKETDHPQAAKDMVVKDLKAAGISLYRIGKVKLIRSNGAR